ncbi:unnamed protein product [Dovyalis caffra]|uniref:Uncharacterized protein n=1 Tax=Dovyalis caffra TaxID=77055 RepID=A0AAV1SGE0_9ROSI|nr:unnamed protein product [Dovyalis caffra]
MTALVLNLPLLSSFTEFRSLGRHFPKNHPSNPIKPYLSLKPPRFPRQVATSMEAEQSRSAANTSSNEPMKLLFVEMGVGYDQHGQDVTAAAMRACRDAISSNSIPAFRRGLLCAFAVTTVKYAITRRNGAGSIPGVTFEQMKLEVKLGIPHSLQQSLDIERVKSVFPYNFVIMQKLESITVFMISISRRYCDILLIWPSRISAILFPQTLRGKIVKFEVVDGGLVCSSGVYVEEMGDKNDDCYIVNAAVNVVIDAGTLREMVADGASQHLCGKQLCGAFGRNENEVSQIASGSSIDDDYTA